jgi:hypothetical protein
MLFDYNVDRAVEDLNKSLLSYFVLATESSQSRGLRPVLVPATSSREVGLQPKRERPILISLSQKAGAYAFSPFCHSPDGAPTISAAIALLYEMTVYLTTAIERSREISGKLAQPSALGSEEVEDVSLPSLAYPRFVDVLLTADDSRSLFFKIVLASGVDLSTRYSSSQRHQLALQSLSRSKKAARQQSLSALCASPAAA